jgi:hypothetical protein
MTTKLMYDKLFLNSFLNLSIFFDCKIDIKLKYKTYVLKNNCVFRKGFNFLSHN